MQRRYFLGKTQVYKPYFCFAPMVVGEFKIEPGKPYVSKYRYLVRDAGIDPAVIGKAWDAYKAGK